MGLVLVGKRFDRTLVRTGVWRGVCFTLKPSKLQKEADKSDKGRCEKGRLYFLLKALVYTKPRLRRHLTQLSSGLFSPEDFDRCSLLAPFFGQFLQ